MPNKVLGTLRFTLPEENTRSLTATQLGDKGDTKIVLGSTAAKLMVATDGKDLGDPLIGTVTMVTTTTPAAGFFDQLGLNKKNQIAEAAYGFQVAGAFAYPEKKEIAASYGTISFTGTSYGFLIGAVEGAARATSKIVSTGTINVATGSYKKWFGKTAVLKYDTISGKAILRIYDDE